MHFELFSTQNRPDDPQRIAGLINYFCPDRKVLPDMAAELIPGSYLFVARDEDKIIVGIARLIIIRIPGMVKGVIEDVMVTPALQGNGVGKGLLKKLIDFAREAHISLISVTPLKKKLEANALYKRVGFCLQETNHYIATL